MLEANKIGGNIGIGNITLTFLFNSLYKLSNISFNQNDAQFTTKISSILYFKLVLYSSWIDNLSLNSEYQLAVKSYWKILFPFFSKSKIIFCFYFSKSL